MKINGKTIIVAVLLIAVLVVTSLYVDDAVRQKNRRRKLDAANIDYIQAGLNLYYINYNRYPLRLNEIKAILEENPRLDPELIDQVTEQLKNLRYEVRGDEKAYKLTYTNADGKDLTIEKSYQADFHEYRSSNGDESKKGGENNGK